MKKAAILIALLILAQPVLALKVDKLEAHVTIDEQGFASVTENYQLSFISDFEFNEFKQGAQSNASSLSAWQSDYNFFKPHFAVAGNTITTSSITFDENIKTLTLTYGLQKKFARLERSEQRADTFVIPDAELSAFNVAGTIVVPEDTTITIILPPNALVDQTNLPQNVSVIGTNQILISGIQSNSINPRYQLLKPIAPTSSDILQGIENGYVLAPIAALIIVGLYVKRDEIEKRVEDYLVEHSEINAHEADEIDLDLSK